jgi:predicted DNA-binding protein with PD1-like motif
MGRLIMKIYSDSIVTALILHVEESIHDCIIRFAGEQILPEAFITGIGVIKDVVLGFFNTDAKEYEKMEVKGPVELLALNGNSSWKGNEPFVHLHAVIGKEDGSVIGGHLLEAKIGTTAEIFIHKIGKRLERKFAEKFGLFFIQ